MILNNLNLTLLSNCIKILTIDATLKAGSGHPGMPMGLSDVMTILVAKYLKFNPNDPRWFERDRLIFSAGHGSMLLYATLYLLGYKDFTIEDIKQFRQLHSKAAGHPEADLYPAIETTTGPLGQGFANAVGMAIAQKKYKKVLPKLNLRQKTYCIVGDGCLMEGMSYEAASLAGHLQLDNLVLIFDDNQITIDGPTANTISEDQTLKFQALGWQVISANGHDFELIDNAFKLAQTAVKPTIIIFQTRIGSGSSKAGTAAVHGSPLARDDVAAFKKSINWIYEPFKIPTDLLNQWRGFWKRNENEYRNWSKLVSKLTISEHHLLSLFTAKYDNEAHETPKIEISLKAKLSELLKDANIDEPTRVSSGKVMEIIAHHPKLMFGSADLAASNNMHNLTTKFIAKDNFKNNYIHYGIREAAMGGVMNGLQLAGLQAVGGTFLVFSDYMKPAIRLAAIMRLPVIYIFTHDSIGVGEDGPTHQPIEHLVSLRSIPNLDVMRPCDIVEVFECWEYALNNDQPTALCLTRQIVPQINKWRAENCSAAGAYIISDSSLTIDDNCKSITIFATGSEVHLAIEVQHILENNNVKCRVVSIPCKELFIKSERYNELCLQNTDIKIAIEAASSVGWHKIIGLNGLFYGIDEFGASAPAKILMNYFKLTKEHISEDIMNKIKRQNIHE